MGTQYRRLSAEHIVAIEKSLLQSQLESLTCVKHIREYRNLRHTELLLKIHVKKLLDEVKQELEILLKGLPEPILEKEEEEIIAVEKQPKRSSLEDELDAIKDKLSRLG